MNFGQSVTTCIVKYFNFKDRASRSEFWWFQLFVMLVSLGFGLFGYLSFETYEAFTSFSDLATLITVIPIISVTARRLHDINKSGWQQLWILTVIGIIPLIVWWARDGSKESNQYGDFINFDDQTT